ncbi:GyrI-like domain-containing protein [Microbacterium sp. zg.Y1090]|uniref:GyrI-like domain-containing protein n=1 Tax=Microbacterium TaxID=33882 RepID=UPI00214B1488|nr:MULTISPECIES: GyrI-like domain-containing protein [unclassified Microbacterium]MCR2811747.1 GyrI-like domain-containing protein [Microbacterium sp. zg.Y1084]MCR2818815.1 GyrI-like domain-containing protein [Microbacterium sp. zg.Y1090]MDL5486906.1 GyrI-like domain-containing protein [Microbacterium sp. zg-Y1211]WIM27129.1 GyrI-like domain-containing protein [Microbacterium sp. zg-Y1090]
MKVDFTKTIDAYRAKAGVFRIVDVPPLRYLAIDGEGDPNTSAGFGDAIAALYPVAYKLKFASKGRLDRDYVVPPLEAQWWADDMAAFTERRDKSAWRWTALMMVPEWIDREMIDDAVAAVAAKSPAPTALERLRWETIAEGRCVQTLHIGSFDDEGDVLARMHDEFIPGEGLRMTGRHHEIYLSDFRRVEPAKLRTILRQPVVPV